MPDATFAAPDLTTFCRLDELGLVAVGHRLEPKRAVIACRVVELDDWCHRCGQEFYAARHEAAGVYGSLGWTSPVSLERALWHHAQDSLCVLSHLAPGARDATRIAGALLAR